MLSPETLAPAPPPLKTHTLAPSPPPPAVQATRLAELQTEYRQLKGAMKLKMGELENQLIMRGQASSLTAALAMDPRSQAGMHASNPHGPPPPHMPMPMQPVMMQVPMPMQGGPVTYVQGPMPPPGVSWGPPPGPGEGPKRGAEDFHHVPPPKRGAMRGRWKGEGGRGVTWHRRGGGRDVDVMWLVMEGDGD